MSAFNSISDSFSPYAFAQSFVRQARICRNVLTDASSSLINQYTAQDNTVAVIAARPNLEREVIVNFIHFDKVIDNFGIVNTIDNSGVVDIDDDADIPDVDDFSDDSDKDYEISIFADGVQQKSADVSMDEIPDVDEDIDMNTTVLMDNSVVESHFMN
jgi:hypothetical protein